ncbi:hypothetical protein ONZ45_g17775 [Pleurotus djamor]|nr:hypothetical protein ONZ45_g17775 [Pleurotus djamor]
MLEGSVSDDTNAFFLSLSQPLHDREDGEELPVEPSTSEQGMNACRPDVLDSLTYKMESVSLYSRRIDVDEENRRRLAELPSSTFVYDSVDGGSGADAWKHLLNITAPSRLELKEGAQVMLLKNIAAGDGLVNGSIGMVISFHTPFDLVSTDPDGYQSSHIRNVSVYPNGQPILRSDVPLDERPAYTALSQQCLARHFKDDDVYPLVAFPLKNRVGTEAILLMRERFRHINASGKTLAWRDQIPLNVAYAISIHKSQGQTIDRLKVDLDGVFEKGQVYVALSRAVRPSGLQVTGFQRSKIEAHSKVVEWYRELRADKAAIA